MPRFVQNHQCFHGWLGAMLQSAGRYHSGEWNVDRSDQVVNSRDSDLDTSRRSWHICLQAPFHRRWELYTDETLTTAKWGLRLQHRGLLWGYVVRHSIWCQIQFRATTWSATSTISSHVLLTHQEQYPGRQLMSLPIWISSCYYSAETNVTRRTSEVSENGIGTKLQGESIMNYLMWLSICVVVRETVLWWMKHVRVLCNTAKENEI